MRPLLVALVLAGCLAPAVPTTGAAGEPPALVLTGCENLSGSFPILSSDARAALPSGFQPRSAETSLHAVFWIVTARCAGSRVDGVETGEAWLSYGEMDVVPPPRLSVPGVEEHTVPTFALAQPPAVADQLAALGLPNVALSDASVTGLPGGARRVTITSGIGSVEMVAAPAGAASPLGAGSWGMFGITDRQVDARLLGTASGGEATPAALSRTSEGALPLMEGARPAARGGMVAGFDLAFARVG